MTHAFTTSSTPSAASRASRGGRLSALALLCALAAACSSSKPSPPPPAGAGRAPAPPDAASSAGAAEAARKPFRVATFNAGLAVGYLPYAEERAPLVVDALAEAPVDLLCVQEVWLERHWQALLSAASPRLPHAHRLAPAPGAAAGATCARAELEPLAACARQHCASLRAGGLGGCVLQHCADDARRLSSGCLNCLISNPVGAVEPIINACTAPEAPPGVVRRTPSPRRDADVVAYGGSFGTGILSREPLADADALVFDATLNPRAALYARLRTPALGELHVVCTHLTPALASPLGGRAPAAEQREQIDRLLPWIEAKTGGRGAVVLLGDFNDGPRAGRTIEAVLPDHYAKLVAAGFQNPYASRPDVRCSFCADNPLNGGSGSRGALIDHVLLRGYNGGVIAEPFLREPIELEIGGKRVRSAYSDHYGVAVTMTPTSG
jgi:endonuclease/exonuclease/phosphatase family metal-dependent hydrolase